MEKLTLKHAISQLQTTTNNKPQPRAIEVIKKGTRAIKRNKTKQQKHIKLCP